MRSPRCTRIENVDDPAVAEGLADAFASITSRPDFSASVATSWRRPPFLVGPPLLAQGVKIAEPLDVALAAAGDASAASAPR
jgi:hypothetical protein